MTTIAPLITKTSRSSMPNAVLFTIPTYNNFSTLLPTISKLYIPELKVILRYYKLGISGNKAILISRIVEHFTAYKRIVDIQRTVRGHFVRQLSHFRGPALKNRDICINATDFYTLEPVALIPFQLFFSYIDSNGFIYGFNIISLAKLIGLHQKTINPYNRSKFTNVVLSRFCTVFNLSTYLFPLLFMESEIVGDINIITPSDNADLTEINTNPTIVNSVIPIIPNVIQTHQTRRIEQRARELFTEIDQLGNYTSVEWLFNLDTRGWYNLYWNLNIIWNAYMFDLKHIICPLGDPFSNVFSNVYDSGTPDIIYKEGCLKVMESIIYTGVDDEFRKLGALFILRALTLVSLPARSSMYWLYESIA
jgi:hypothetical protein